jgi:hypothetical protein
VITTRGVGIRTYAIESCSSRGYGSGFRETIVLGLELPTRDVFRVRLPCCRASLSEVPEICVVAVSILKVDGVVVSGIGVSMCRGLTTGVSEHGVSTLRDGGIGASDIGVSVVKEVGTGAVKVGAPAVKCKFGVYIAAST